jgi:DNA-binding response OmpR family regulator
MKNRLLLIEGKRVDRPSYMAGLSKKGYIVESAPNGASALEMIRTSPPKAVIVDAASMRTSGSRICSALKREMRKVPVFLIIAEGQENYPKESADVILRLPFTVQKLLNRLRPFMSVNENKKLQCGPITLDMKERWVYCGDQRARLTPRLFTLMETFLRRPGEVITREELFKKLWETDYVGDTRSLDVHISWLRRAICPDPRTPKYIKTERGIGYRLDIEKPKRPEK